MHATAQPVRFVASRTGDAALAARLRREVEAEVLFDRASRGRYATDASIYQVEPVGVVVPRTEEAVRATLAIAAEEGVPVLPRGAGSSQCGQAVGAALVIDGSKHLQGLLELDVAGRHAVVQPGLVLDQLNATLRRHGLWFPVDVSTSAQATLGGMAGNNSCGARSIVYGNMVHNVLAIDALTSDGQTRRFGPLGDGGELASWLRALYAREKDEIVARFPQVLRRVAGYNLDHLGPPHENAAHLLVGSEGTLAWFERLHLKLAPLPAYRVLGVCHFPKFYTAMELTQHIVKLGPAAVELVDRTMIGLARQNAAFRATVEAAIRGEPDAILLVEFAGDEKSAQEAKLKRLVQLLGDLGLPGSVVEVTEARLQRDLWEVRKAGLNIMMSMKGDGKPVSFIEDCAVPLEHLAEYTDRLTQVFARHGTRGTWYAHASVGTLHVRPILDMRRDGATKMRAITEEACAMVRQYKGAYSGEHGDGLVRSEWIAPFFGPRLTAVLGEIKARLDSRGLMNPGKIVDPPKMDDRRLFRFAPGYATQAPPAALDWGEWGGAWWWLMIAAIVAAVWGFRRWLRDPSARLRYDSLKLRLPLVGRVTRGNNAARFARTFSILAASAVPVLEALRIAAEVVTNTTMRRAVQDAAVRVREGAPIARSIGASKLFPPMLVHLVASGETSGELEAMLERAASNQERELDGLVNTAVGILGPVMILLMGAFVFVIVIALLLPIFQLNQLVR